MGDSNLYFGGLPTEPDLKRLREKWPVNKMSKGEIISYEDVAREIKVAPGSNRFKTVTAAWRKELQQSDGVVVKPPKMPDGTFRVLTDPEKHELSIDTLRQGTRKMKRAVALSHVVDRKELSEDQRKQQDHLQARVAAMMLAGNMRTTKKLLPDIDGQGKE